MATASTRSSAPKISPALATPTDLSAKAREEIAHALNKLVADALTLYMKTKNFHWHMSGPHFRDYHLLLDEQADQIFASIDPLAERVRKLGQRTLVSFKQTLSLTSIDESGEEFVPPSEMLHELMEDNKAMAAHLRKAHSVCDDHDDSATASLIEVYIDETERRTWFLFETNRRSDQGGH